jgi:hypothetical protein
VSCVELCALEISVLESMVFSFHLSRVRERERERERERRSDLE